MNMQSELLPFAVIIPAAGNSGRMGTGKALLAYDDEETFASHIAKSYLASGAHPVLLVVNEQHREVGFGENQIIQLINKHVDRGRSYSILLGIQHIPHGTACFIQNIDNPFIERDLLEQMIAISKSDGFVVPVWNGMGGHPVLLGSDIVNYIHGMKALPDFREVLKLFKRIVLPYPDERVLWNINTPEDYTNFLTMI